MSETRIRELFDQAAEDLQVGPAPDLTSFVAARRSRHLLAAVSAGLVAAAAVGVVVAVTMVDSEPGGGPTKSPVTPVQTTGTISLDCHTNLRSVSTWEGAGPYRRTPLALGRLFTNPVADEHVVLQSVDGRTAEVVLLRGDGTAWARLDLRYETSRGWSLYTTLSCPSRYVRMYYQHQPQF